MQHRSNDRIDLPFISDMKHCAEDFLSVKSSGREMISVVVNWNEICKVHTYVPQDESPLREADEERAQTIDGWDHVNMFEWEIKDI
jgi:hypothetical protein